MPLNADLHCHSIVSDGLLPPAEVVRRAHANGVEMLALTDHDETGGLAEARAEADTLGLRFIDGVEISISWGDDQTVHIVGLGVDPANAGLLAGLHHIRSGRDSRAARMAAELEKVGIHDAYEGALKYVGNPALISRAHFARFIVEKGHTKDVKSVFDHWLAKGKPGYVEHAWATLSDAVGWIVGFVSVGADVPTVVPGSGLVPVEVVPAGPATFVPTPGPVATVCGDGPDRNTIKNMIRPTIETPPTPTSAQTHFGTPSACAVGTSTAGATGANTGAASPPPNRSGALLTFAPDIGPPRCFSTLNI